MSAPVSPLRWTALRKFAVVRDVRRARCTRAQALAVHGLSEEELASWERRFAADGVAGLRVDRVQAPVRRS